MTQVVRCCWLVAVWLLLWGTVTAANILSGVAVAALVITVAGRRRATPVIVRPLAALRLAGHFAVHLVAATAYVAWEVVTPRNRIRTGIVAVPLHGCSDAVATLIADVISLTPGTLTVEVDPDPLTLYVHVLHLRDVERVRRDVRRIEVLAVRAFGSAEALAGLAVDDSHAMETR
jgi:multicomponent Na+:H+ antiporter subunit E